MLSHPIDLPAHIRTLGRWYGLQNIITIATTGCVYITMRWQGRAAMLCFLGLLGQLLAAQCYTITCVTLDDPWIYIAAVRFGLPPARCPDAAGSSDQVSAPPSPPSAGSPSDTPGQASG